MPTLHERLIKARVKLLKDRPFFGTLLLHAPIRESKDIPTAATDGSGLIFNPDFVDTLTDKQFPGILIHEVLHAALAHVPRMKDVFKTNPEVANVACDIVVNGICDDNNIELTDGAVRDNKLKHLSVREIYTILMQQISKDKNHLKKKYGIDSVNKCLADPDSSQGKNSGDGNGSEEGEGNSPSMSETDWKDIMNKAATIARMKKAGPVGAAMDRIFAELMEPTLDWRTILYKYITESRTDFSGYDRRFVFDNLYLDDFAGSKVHILVYIDVSGSIDEQLLTDFMSEVNGAIKSVESVEGEAYCFDTRVHHVCPIADIEREFKLIGGGGTCFRCIFKHINEYTAEHPCDTVLPIILTDGYADLDLPRTDPLLWVIAPGGIDSKSLPFGDVTRITR
jgi:predicted metal-dependent peptidase